MTRRAALLAAILPFAPASTSVSVTRTLSSTTACTVSLKPGGNLAAYAAMTIETVHIVLLLSFQSLLLWTYYELLYDLSLRQL